MIGFLILVLRILLEQDDLQSRVESENSSSGVIQPCIIKSMNTPINGLLWEFGLKG